MKFAAIADVHGNCPALEAVLADITDLGIGEVGTPHACYAILEHRRGGWSATTVRTVRQRRHGCVGPQQGHAGLGERDWCLAGSNEIGRSWRAADSHERMSDEVIS